jgi:predicted phage terminase large subunit-like protein
MTSFASQLDYLVDAITANPQIVEQALVGLDPAEKLTLLAQIEEAARRRTVARAADDLASYCRIVMPGFEEPEHILRMIDAMERIEAGALKRLIVAMPPRMGKTQLTGILFPSWYLGRRGGRDVIFTTYAQELANDRGRAIKEIMNGDAYAGLFPGTKIRQDTSAAQRFRTTTGNNFYAVGVGGPLTGRGGHLVLVDDPIKNREEAESAALRNRLIDWYRSALRTRLAPGGAIVIVATRWHLGDLTGHVLQEASNEGWEVLEFPAVLDDRAALLLGRTPGTALWPERYPLDEMLATKKAVGAREWSALYQQKPVPDGGGIVKRDDVQEWKGSKAPECSMVVASWDTAYGQTRDSDFSAGTMWGVFEHPDKDGAMVKCAILLGARRGRWQFGELKAQMIQADRDHGVDFSIVEAKASGLSAVQELRTMGLPMRTYVPKGRKDDRLHAVAPLFEQHRIYAPLDKEWAQGWLNQLANFPADQNDDYVDSTSQALKMLRLGGGLSTSLDAPARKRTGGTRGYW